MRFIAKISIGGAPQPVGRGCANVHLSCHCADLALLYGKGPPLSPVCRAFWAILAGAHGPE
ncbi:MAG: hypothetical protein WA303_02405, partial [Bradyrhizobium sp.]